MGAWSDTVHSSGSLSGILADSTDYLQYRVILHTDDLNSSPVLEEVLFTYDLLVGVGESCSGEVPSWEFSSLENPSHGDLTLSVGVIVPGPVDLMVYDSAGRLVASDVREYPVGSHSVSFSGLPEGVYHCTMRAGEFEATERVVLLR